MLHLPAVEHALQPAGLLRQLEQPLPLVLGQQGLLERGAAHVLRLALGLPLSDLILLAGKRTLVVLEVVGLGVVCLDGVKEKVAVLLQERVDAQGQVLEVGGENGGGGDRAALQSSERGREVQRPRRRVRGQLVEEGVQEVGVVDVHGKLDEDILVSKVRLLQATSTWSEHCTSAVWAMKGDILLSGELVLLERLHELRRQAEGAQAQAALGAAADVVDESDRPLVHLLLVEVLVLDDVQVDEVAHVGAGVPPDVVRVDVHLPQHPDHLRLVGHVRFRSGSGRRGVWRGAVKMRVRRHLDHGEREAVGDLQSSPDVHTNDGTGRRRGEGLGAVFDDLHDHLYAAYQYLADSETGTEDRTRASTWTAVRGVSFLPDR